MDVQKKAAEKKESEKAKAAIVQVDDLLTFRQFSKKAADDVIDVSSSVVLRGPPDSSFVKGLRGREPCDWRGRGYGRLHFKP